MPFDPNQPFEVVGQASGFDPNAPFEEVSSSVKASSIDDVPRRTIAQLRAEASKSPSEPFGFAAEAMELPILGISGIKTRTLKNIDEFEKRLAATPVGQELEFLKGSGRMVTKTGYGEFADPGAAGVNEFNDISELIGGTAATSALPTTAFLRGMGAGLKVPGPPLVKGGAGLGLGLAAAGTAALAQRGILEEVAPEFSKRQDELTEEYPKIATTTQVATSGFKPGFTGPIRREVAQRLFPGGLGVAIQGAREVYANKDKEGLIGEGGLKRMAIEGGLNALMKDPNAYGRSQIQAGGKSIVGRLAGIMDKKTPQAANIPANELATDTPVPQAPPPAPRNVMAELNALENDFSAYPKDIPGQKPSKKPDDIEFQNKQLAEELKAQLEAARERADLANARSGPSDVNPEVARAAAARQEAERFEAERPVNVAGAKFTRTLGETRGQRVSYAGYEGRLHQDVNGDFGNQGAWGVLQDVTTGGKPNFVEIEGSGKDPSVKLSDVGVEQVPVEVGPNPRTDTGDKLPLYSAGFSGLGALGELSDEEDDGILNKVLMGAGMAGMMLRTPAQRQKFMSNFGKVFDKIQTRTKYGDRVETAKERSMVLSWSNGSRTWGVNHFIGNVKEGAEVKLHANDVLVPHSTTQEARYMAQNLPPLPLDAYSAENNPPSPKGTREVSPNVEVPSSLDDFLKRESKQPALSSKQSYMDKMLDRINAEFRTEEGPSSGSTGIMDNNPDPRAGRPDGSINKQQLEELHGYLLHEVHTFNQFGFAAQDLNSWLGKDSPWVPWLLQKTGFWKKANAGDKLAIDPDQLIANAKLPSGWKEKNGEYTQDTDISGDGRLTNLIPALQNAAPAIGGAVGYIGGDTQEDKERSALALAGLGMSLRRAGRGGVGNLGALPKMSERQKAAIGQTESVVFSKLPVSPLKPKENLFRVVGITRSGKSSPEDATNLENRKYGAVFSDIFKPEEIKKVVGPVVAKKILDVGKELKMGETAAIDNLTSVHFAARYPRGKDPFISGATTPATMANLAGAGVGGVAGFAAGETPEEKLALGAAGALGGFGLAKGIGRLSNLSKPVKAASKAPTDAPSAEAPSAEPDYYDQLFGITKEVKEKAAALPKEQNMPQGVVDPQEIYKWTPFLSNTTIGQVIKKGIGTIEDNILSINKRVGGAVREYMGFKDNLKVNWSAIPEVFFKEVRAALTPEELDRFDWHIQGFGKDGSNHQMAEDILFTKPASKNLAALFQISKQTYAEMGQALKDVGREVNLIDDAWPRQMIDGGYEKLRKMLDMEEQSGLQAALDVAAKDKTRPLTDGERADLINNAIAMTLRGKPTFLKPRTVHGLTIEQFRQVYEPFDIAFANRIARVSTDVARRRFMGRDAPEDAKLWLGKGGDFGKIITEEMNAGRIPTEGHDVIMQNLKDLLHQETQTNDYGIKLGNLIGRIQNFAFLGDIMSAVSQFGDVFPNIYAFRPTAAIKGYGSSIRFRLGRGSKGESGHVKLSDLGLGGETFGELAGLSRGDENTKFSRLTNFVLKYTSGWADSINKESGINSARHAMIGAINDPNSLFFLEKEAMYSQMFPERWPEILKDLKGEQFRKGILTENTRFYLYNELANLQPLNTAQRAQLESSNPGWRWAYSLKRYWIKQLGILRMDAYEKIKNPKTRAEGVRNLALFTAMVAGAQGLVIGTIKDYVFGKEIDEGTLMDNTISGMTQIFGVNRYGVSKFREQGFRDALASQVLPISDIGRDLGRDYSTLLNDTDDKLQSLKYLPFVGRLYHNQFGAGVEANERAESKRLRGEARGESKSPTLAELEKLILPPPPKQRR